MLAKLNAGRKVQPLLSQKVRSTTQPPKNMKIIAINQISKFMITNSSNQSPPVVLNNNAIPKKKLTKSTSQNKLDDKALITVDQLLSKNVQSTGKTQAASSPKRNEEKATSPKAVAEKEIEIKNNENHTDDQEEEKKEHDPSPVVESTDNKKESLEEKKESPKATLRMSSSDDRPAAHKKSAKKLPNVDFYRGQRKSNQGWGGEFIDKILERKKKYKILESDHAYIQWIFPNKFQSQFNMSAEAITNDEIEIFLNDIEIAKKYVQAYEMMLDFYGIKLASKETGLLLRAANYKERYSEAIVGHNCLRIRRILTSLNNLGFRKYAIQLCSFLKKEIFEGDQPLKRREKDYLTGWVQYGSYSNREELELLEKNTFSKLDEINRENIFFKSFSPKH